MPRSRRPADIFDKGIAKLAAADQTADVLLNISSATLRKMVKLSERKEALLFQIQELDRQMVALQQSAEEDGAFIRPKAAAKPKAPRKSDRRKIR
jgi:hypothetical protein